VSDKKSEVYEIYKQQVEAVLVGGGVKAASNYAGLVQTAPTASTMSNSTNNVSSSRGIGPARNGLMQPTSAHTENKL